MLVNAKGRKPPRGRLVPSHHPLRHRVFTVRGTGYDRLDQAMAAAGRPYVDGEPVIVGSWEDRPVTPSSSSRAVKGSGYRMKNRRK